MNSLQIFDNERFGKIRAIEIDGDPWFCLADICEPLGLRATRCRERLKAEGVRIMDTPTKSGNQGMLWVNEGNLYRAIFQSKKPEAEQFTDWVTEEVLPTLRKTGTYSIDNVEPFPPSVSLSGLSSHIETLRRVMLESGDTPQDVRNMVVFTLKSLSVPVPPPLQHPAQLNLFSADYPAIAGGEQA